MCSEANTPIVAHNLLCKSTIAQRQGRSETTLLRRRETHKSVMGIWAGGSVLLLDDQRSNSHYSSLVIIKSLIPFSLSNNCPPSFLSQTHPPEGVTLYTAHISWKAHFFRGQMARVSNVATSSKAVLFPQSTHLENWGGRGGGVGEVGNILL